MRRRWMRRVVKFVLLAAVAVGVFSFVVMRLWNWLLPAIFGFPVITFWQALGLLILSRILLGGFRGGPGRGMHWRNRMRERWNQMSPEEREKFVAGVGSRCGRVGPRVAEPTP